MVLALVVLWLLWRARSRCPGGRGADPALRHPLVAPRWRPTSPRRATNCPGQRRQPGVLLYYGAPGYGSGAYQLPAGVTAAGIASDPATGGVLDRQVERRRGRVRRPVIRVAGLARPGRAVRDRDNRRIGRFLAPGLPVPALVGSRGDVRPCRSPVPARHDGRGSTEDQG